MRKPTIWVSEQVDTNQAGQSQKIVKKLEISDLVRTFGVKLRP